MSNTQQLHGEYDFLSVFHTCCSVSASSLSLLRLWSTDDRTRSTHHLPSSYLDPHLLHSCLLPADTWILRWCYWSQPPRQPVSWSAEPCLLPSLTTTHPPDRPAPHAHGASGRSSWPSCSTSFLSSRSVPHSIAATIMRTLYSYDLARCLACTGQSRVAWGGCCRQHQFHSLDGTAVQLGDDV